MRAPKGIRPSPMDTGYDKVKNLDPSHQILVIYKALYGLARSPKLHMAKMRRVLESDGYRSTDAEPCVYVKKLWNEDGTPKMVEQRKESLRIIRKIRNYRKCKTSILSLYMWTTS